MSSCRIADVDRSSTEGVVITADTIDGVPNTEGAGSGKLDTPYY